MDYVVEIERLLGIASRTVYRTTEECPRAILRRAFTHATSHNKTEASRLIKEAKKIMGE